MAGVLGNLTVQETKNVSEEGSEERLVEESKQNAACGGENTAARVCCLPTHGEDHPCERVCVRVFVRMCACAWAGLTFR